jgi:hypothetical protein
MEHAIEPHYEGILNAYAPQPVPGEMETEAQAFKTALNEALRAIDADFFSLPIAGQDEEKVFERRFAYELYHQLRNRFERDRFDFALDPEIDKRAHPVVRTKAIPDLIVHRAGSMKWNLCVIEIKPISGAKAGFEKDAEHLRSFVRLDEYHNAMMIVYGSADSPRDLVREKMGCDFSSLNKDGVRILWQSEAGAPVVEF